MPSGSPKANVKSLFYFCFSSSDGYETINAREESNSVEHCCVWKLSKGKRLNVYVAVSKDIWFGKGECLHRLVITFKFLTYRKCKLSITGHRGGGGV